MPGAVAGATSRSTDKLDVFLTDAKGEVHTAAWEPSLGWRNWKLRDRLSAGSQVPNLPPGAPITVVSRSADHLDIFVLDKHGSIWSAAWQPGFAFWAGWWALPGIRGAPGSAVRAISRSPDQLDLFATGADGEVHTAAWNPRSPWEGGKLRDRMPEATIPDLAAGCPIAAASRRTDYLDIFVVAKDRRIWTAAWEPSRNWLGWRPIGY